MKYIITFLLTIASFVNFASSEMLKNENVAENQQKEFNIILTIDNKLKNSQDAGTNVALSLINGLAYISDKNDWNENILQRLLTGYATYFVALWNHEISGHGLRAKEFGQKISHFTMDGLFSAATHLEHKFQLHQQKRGIINIAGLEANHVLLQKILNNLVDNRQFIDPVTASAYVFSSQNQLFYTLSTKENRKGDDIKEYVTQMEKIYGKKSVTLKKVKLLAYLDLLDPMLFASLYSFGSGNDVKLPILKITDNLGIMPSVKLILTPYGVLEKRLVMYIDTDYTGIKASFGFGKETKTNQPLPVQLKASNNNTGIFTNPSGPIKNNNTYYGELVINKVIAFDQLNVGVTLAGWKQPELFVNDPYNAKIKQGGMIVLNSQYSVNNALKISCDLGYKSKGYVLGQVTSKTSIIRAGLQWKL